MCAKMAQYLLGSLLKRQIVASKNLPKCHIFPYNPDDMAVSGIGTKIATVRI